MATILLAGLGGIGSLLLQRLDEAEKWTDGRNIALIVAVDFLPTPKAIADARARIKRKPCVVLHWDATNLSSTEELAAAIDASTTRLDAALITTGMGFHGSLDELSLRESERVLQRLLAVNAVGPSLLAQHCVKRMVSSPAAFPGITPTAPVLLLLSSYSGVIGLPLRAAYCASKFALNGFAEALYSENQNARIVLVCPTSVSTPFRDNWKQHFGEGAKPIEVNKAEMTAEECAAGVWAAFTDPTKRRGELQYVILPDKCRNWRAHALFALSRIPAAGQYARAKALKKLSSESAQGPAAPASKL